MSFDDEFRIPCPNCGAIKQWRRSPRKHGKPGRYFVVCKNCEYESQATNAGIFNTNPTKRRADDQRATRIVTARLTESEYSKVLKSGKNIHEIIVDWLDKNQVR